MERVKSFLVLMIFESLPWKPFFNIPGKRPYEHLVLRNTIFSAEWKVQENVIASTTPATELRMPYYWLVIGHVERVNLAKEGKQVDLNFELNLGDYSA